MPLKKALVNPVFKFEEPRKSNAFKGLLGLLADVLPDRYGNSLINAWLATEGRVPNSMTPVEMLCFIGKRGMGALEFEPALPKNANTATTLKPNSLIKIAEDILTGRKNF